MPEMLKLSQSLVACLLAASCGAVTPAPHATARVRVAHVSPGAPAVDFCLARHGTTQFTGPILADAGRAAGLSYATVTRYFEVDAARYDVRLVAPGAASCAQPLAGLDDFTRLPELTDGASATIAAEGALGGQGDAAFTLRAYADDAEAPPGQASLRLVHASPGTPPVDAGTGGGVGGTAQCLNGTTATFGPFDWSQGQAPKNTGLAVASLACGLTRVTGHFEGAGESLLITSNPTDPNATWMLQGTSQQQGVAGSAMCAQ
jgi:hypothetical protein